MRASGKLIVLSGGEPFEHPDISEILSLPFEQTPPFRIATGGFVDLSPWIEKLKYLNRPEGPLQGISIGTDVLSKRVVDSRWVQTWQSNIQLLGKFKIPYSLTFTIGPDLDFLWLHIWNWTDFFEEKPTFIYLRHSRNDLINDWMGKIYKSFGEIRIIVDDISMPSDI